MKVDPGNEGSENDAACDGDVDAAYPHEVFDAASGVVTFDLEPLNLKGESVEVVVIRMTCGSAAHAHRQRFDTAHGSSGCRLRDGPRERHECLRQVRVCDRD